MKVVPSLHTCLLLALSYHRDDKNSLILLFLTLPANKVLLPSIYLVPFTHKRKKMTSLKLPVFMDCSSARNHALVGLLRCPGGVLYTFQFLHLWIEFSFLMSVSLIPPQGLSDLWGNKYDGVTSLERRHIVHNQKEEERTCPRGCCPRWPAPWTSHGNLTHLSCGLPRNCCCKRLIKSGTSHGLVGNMEKEGSHRTALSWEDLGDSAQVKMTWNLCIDTVLPIHLQLTECCIISLLQSRGGMFWFHHRFSTHFVFGISL